MSSNRCLKLEGGGVVVQGRLHRANRARRRGPDAALTTKTSRQPVRSRMLIPIRSTCIQPGFRYHTSHPSLPQGAISRSNRDMRSSSHPDL